MVRVGKGKDCNECGERVRFSSMQPLMVSGVIVPDASLRSGSGDLEIIRSI